MKSSSNDFANPGGGKGSNKRVEVKPRAWQLSKSSQNKKTSGDTKTGGDSKPKTS